MSLDQSLIKLIGTLKRQHSITLTRLAKLEEQLGHPPEPEPVWVRVFRYFREEHRNVG